MTDAIAKHKISLLEWKAEDGEAVLRCSCGESFNREQWQIHVPDDVTLGFFLEKAYDDTLRREWEREVGEGEEEMKFEAPSDVEPYRITIKDPEIAAMAGVVEALEGLDAETCARVVRWATDRWRAW